MKKILFLGDSNETYELLQQAKANGLYTIVTDYCQPSRSTAKRYSDEYWMVSTSDLDELERMCISNNISAVISGASDYNIEMSIRLCERLGLPKSCSLKVWYDTKNKLNFKRNCIEMGVSVPKNYCISEELNSEELEKVTFPVVVKPIDREGNAGVTFCYSKEELIRGYQYAKTVSHCNKVMVEQMIDGTEFFCYYLLVNGEAFFLTLGIRLSQHNEPKFCYSISTSINSFTNSYLNTMNQSVIGMLKNIGCMDGIVCVQCMRDLEGKFYAFEMCYSPEGSILINPIMKDCGFDVIQWQLECALGIKHKKNNIPQLTGIWKRCANSYILFSKKGGIITEILGMDVVEKMPNVMVHMHTHEGDIIEPYSPMGNIMFDTDDSEQLCRIIQEINQKIKIINDKGENILIYFNDFYRIRQEYQNMINDNIY